MVCNPDGSIFIDSQYQVSPNLYDLAHTYQSGGWYWFNMTPSENIEFDRNKTLRVPNIRHNKQFFSTQYSWMANFEKENGYWPDWDWSFYQHRSYVNNYYTQENEYGLKLYAYYI